MTDTRDSRDYDVVVLGATGYTARLADAHLARHRPEGLRWALAGRSRERLEAARADLVAIDPRLADLPIEVVELTDAAGLAALAARTRVLDQRDGALPAPRRAGRARLRRGRHRLRRPHR